ncbi:MAG: glycoside hydrolase family 20 zincin-like fold domain-containing protein, partial [Candidatus Hydrogenedentota bacterium]
MRTILQAVAFVTCGVCVVPSGYASDTLDLARAVVVVRPGDLPNAERAAATVLVEEFERRTGIQLEQSTRWPANRTVIAITSKNKVSGWRDVPRRKGSGLPESEPEGLRLYIDGDTVWVVGADARGCLFGVGALLRNLNWGDGRAELPASLDIATAPAYPIRGHQLGFRTQANSWDAWTPEQFDQHIRELTFFGMNSVENIPFHDDRVTPLMKVSRREMNRRMSEICQRYGLDYWVWVPADYDLNDAAARAKGIDAHEELYRDCPELTGVFFPGGDPGDNSPELVMPFLEDLSKRLLPIHPNAKLWLSLQGFNRAQSDFVMQYIERESPDWLGGIVAGPSSPPVARTRLALPAKYKLRLYPDITHNKICQYPVPWWDQAYALTLGREAINPRPAQYAYIHNWFAPYSDGFISYSDGVHDDVNKTVWSALSWDPSADPREILIEYCRVFFGPEHAEQAADGIFALEKNWRGPAKENGAVEGTLQLWQQLEAESPQLANNWRWQMCLVRAYYDAHVRRRLLNETRLEREANAVLAQCKKLSADKAMVEAMQILNRAVNEPISPELRQRIVALCEDLFQSCGLQTSVPIYQASGAERGAFLDFVDYPLNNRWWIEDEFKKIAALPSEKEKCARLNLIAAWESPGPGSFYDDIGNPAN